MHYTISIERRWVQALLLIGFWVLVGVLYAGMRFLALRTLGEVPGTFHPLWIVLGWCTWIPTSLIALGIIRRFPVTGRTWPLAVLVHLMGAAFCSLFASVLFTSMKGLGALLIPPTDFAYGDFLMEVFTRSLALDSIIYLTLLVGVHAFEYYRRYRTFVQQAQELKSDLAEAQLRALSLELRPHFLFNTLHAIAMMVGEHEEEQAQETIANLSDFLRYVLESEGVQEVPLEQELNFLKSYMAIEQARFEDRIEVRVEATPEALQARVPNLLLQPLVENALHHGLRSSAHPGLIAIDARREGTRLRIRVQDSGMGLPAGWTFDTHRGIGLSNTTARLHRLYGADHRLLFTNIEAGGLMVTIVIPYRVGAEVPAREPASRSGYEPLKPRLRRGAHFSWETP